MVIICLSVITGQSGISTLQKYVIIILYPMHWYYK